MTTTDLLYALIAATALLFALLWRHDRRGGGGET